MDSRNVIQGRSAPRVKIKVSAEIIAASAIKDSSHCMIAEAIKHRIPEAKYISVDLATIRFTDRDAGVRYIYLTPRSAQAALLAFDSGERPEPFGFRLEGAHVLAAGKNARQAKASLVPDPRATSTNQVPPLRKDGHAPPMGPLRGGDLGGPAIRTGRRREFGLRAILR